MNTFFYPVKLVLLLGSSLFLPLFLQNSLASQASIEHQVTTAYHPIVLNGRQLSTLTGQKLSAINVFADNDGIKPIPFQIDQRDKEGLYLLASKNPNQTLFKSDDECVFMANDTGNQINNPKKVFKTSRVVEIKVKNDDTGRITWAYLVASFNAARDKASHDYIQYDSAKDTINSQHYRIGFSAKKPFLPTELRWKEMHNGKWSDNYITGMVITHLRVESSHNKFLNFL